MPTRQTIELFSATLSLTCSDEGDGRTFLLLHGGAGTASMAGLAAALATEGRSILPTHPGFDGEPRPDWFRRVDDLVLAYLQLLERLDLTDVVIVGNSVGGWVAAEMALRASPRISGIVLINAVGIDTGSPDRGIADPMTAAAAERLSMVFHDPSRFAAAPPSEEALTAMKENQRNLRVYAGDPFMHDPTLRPRLAAISIPTLVLWGESDRVVDIDYGRRYAGSISDAEFRIVAEAGHLPQLEQLEVVVDSIRGSRR